MKFKKMIAILVLLSMIAMPVLGDLTDYQRGVTVGLKAGLMMGKLLGAAAYDTEQARQYNAMVDQFNQGLAAAFADNQTAMNMFWMQPYGSGAIVTTPMSVSRKPVHAIDASWNNSTRVLGDQDIGKRIYDMPASSYYTWVGDAPDLPYTGGEQGYLPNV